MRTTTDRGDIIHFAGFQHLSPAVDERSRPTFSGEPGDQLARCGWEALFKMMSASGLALEYDAADPASARFVAARRGSHGAASHHGLGQAAEHAKRFWRALFPER